MNDPATAVQALDTPEGVLNPSPAGDIGRLHVHDGAGTACGGTAAGLRGLPSHRHRRRHRLCSRLPHGSTRLRKLRQDLRHQARPGLLDRRLTGVEGELAAHFPPDPHPGLVRRPSAPPRTIGTGQSMAQPG
ncbi:hypothetical protein [Streptomyces sp. NPDC002463]|uniref:hypothetical protein n=1 Tax=Streptomyces sp. NPDC002463 TaxID=3364645 RepID=UPI0036AEB93A